MADPKPIAELSDAQKIVLKEAEDARIAAAGKEYKPGGNTTEGFDCSGFVIYVFNKAYKGVLPRVTAEDLRSGGFFRKVEKPQPGDLIFFGEKKTATHVGIVINATEWIGSQSSKGVRTVKFNDSYWNPKILSYGRYKDMVNATAIIPAQAGSYASVINPAP